MKKNIKDILLKVLHVVSYILSVLFILGCIVFGVGSCNLNKNSSSNNVNNSKFDEISEVAKPVRKSLSYDGENYKYVVSIKSNLTTSWNSENYLQTGNYVIPFIPNRCVALVNQYVDLQMFVLLNGSSIVYNDNVIRNDEYNAIVIRCSFSASDSKCYLASIYLNGVNGSQIYLWDASSGGYYDVVTILYNDFSFNSININTLQGQTFDNEAFYKLFFNIDESEDVYYSFNNYDINPIQFYSYEIMTDNTAHNVGSYTGHVDLDMRFVSNGQSFKKMRFQYDYVVGTWFDNQEAVYSDMTYLALSYIAYQKTYNDEWVKVCYPRIYRYDTRTLNNVAQLYAIPFTDFNTYLWANDGYKDIVIVNGSRNIFSRASGDPIANLTNIQVLTYQGEMNTIGVDVSNTTNVFVLLGEGFTSVSSLFGIILLPGITIGTLLFLPLVVAIVLAIIKLLRK